MLISLSKSFLEFILESPTFLGGSRNHCEAIQPGKTRIFDDRYTVFVWELVSYWPVFLHLSFEACIFFIFQFSMFLFLFLGWYFLYHDHCAVCCCYNLHNKTLVSEELYHPAGILHVCAGDLIFMMKKKSWTYPISWIENAHLRAHRKLREMCPGQRRQLLLLIFDILKRKIENLNTLRIKNWSQ